MTIYIECTAKQCMQQHVLVKNGLFCIFDFALDHDLLQVTGPESLEISWAPPLHPNGVISGYELRRDGEVIYVGTETRYHDFTLSPNVEYSYTLRANNSKGAASSAAATAKTHPSAPSGVGLPTLTPLGPEKVHRSTLPLLTNFKCTFHAGGCLLYQVKVQWNSPARPNGDIVSYTVYQKDPVQLGITSSVITPDNNDFSERQTTLHGLDAYHRSVVTALYSRSPFNKQKCSETTVFDTYRTTCAFVL